MRLSHWAVCGLFFGLLAGNLSSVRADNPPGTKPAAKVTSQDPVKEWAELVAKREELNGLFKPLFEQLQKADGTQKRAVIAQIQKLQQENIDKIQEFQQKIQPRLIELAPLVYEKDPKNKEAGQLVNGIKLSKAYEANDYAAILKITAPMLKEEKPDALAYNLAGLAYFAQMDFPKAQQLFAKAAAAEPRMFQGLSARFAETIPDYIGFWKQEQEIRDKEAKADDLPRVLIKTNKGNIEVELFENEAPNTVANFINLVEKKFYDGTKFHRVMPNFMAQGGDPNSKNDDPEDDGMGGPGYYIACECFKPNYRKHFAGSLSMAHSRDKDTGGSQFFITHLPTAHLNALPGKEESNHTVFGRVLKGMDVVLALKIGDKIESATVERKRNHKYVPETLPETKRPAAIPGIRKPALQFKAPPKTEE